MRLTLVAVIVSLSALLGAGAASAQTSATIAIEDEGVLLEGGEAALVFVVVECTLAPGDELLEGFISLGQATGSGMSGLNPRCDGKQHHIAVRVRALSGAFEAGEAFASAFLLFLDPDTGTTLQAQASKTITLRGPG